MTVNKRCRGISLLGPKREQTVNIVIIATNGKPHNFLIVISVYMHLQKGSLDHLRQNLGATLVWRTYILDTFRTTSISQDYLDKIRADLAAAESASFTLVIRFCYIFEMVWLILNALVQ
jgi:hypothetical protein